MSRRNWVNRLFAPRPSAVCKPRKRPHRLAVENLEDRSVPSVTSVFELDANVVTTTTHDWDQVFADNQSDPPGTTSGALASAFVTDAFNSSGDDIFTGGGSKDTLGIQDGAWLFADSKPQAKNDITNAYAAAYTDPSNGHLLLYVGLDRYDNSGDATVGFWFFHNQIGQNPDVTQNGGHPFIGTHSDGDILLVSDFTQGGSVSTIKVFRWTGDDATGSLVAVADVPSSTFAIVNGGPISTPWSYINKSGQAQPAAGEFFEGGVDLTALGISGCFSSFLAETRSSQSPTATLSDFVLGSFPLCSIEAIPSAGGLSKIGDPSFYSFAVTNTGAFPLYPDDITDTLLGDLVIDGVAQDPDGDIITSIDYDTQNVLVNGTLAPGATLTIQVTRIVQPTDPDPIVNTTTYVFNDEADFSAETVTDSAVSNPINLFQPSATMSVTALTDEGDTTAETLGENITYTITLNNTSSADSPNLQLGTALDSLNDTLLGDLEAAALVAIDALDGIADGDTSLAPGESVTFTIIRAIEAGDSAVDNTLENTTSVDFSLAGFLGNGDPFLNDVTASDPASVDLIPHLTIEKTVNGPDVIGPGDTASFTITVSNDGAGAVTNVVVTDQLPEPELLAWGVDSSTFDTATLSSTDLLTATQDRLAAGATNAVTVSAVIPSDIFGNTDNTGEGNGNPVPLSIFELDGNTVNGPAAGEDWNDIHFGTGSAIVSSFVSDPINSQQDNIFTGGGSKDTQGIEDGPWLSTTSKPQAKNDIEHAYASLYEADNGDRILYVGLDRWDNSGDATVGFWFFRNSIAAPADGTGAFTGEHAEGDILLVSNFSQGGGVSTIKVFEWIGDDATGHIQELAAVPGTTFAVSNGGAIDVPWNFTDKSHNTDPIQGEFFEGGVNLTGLGLGGCFSNFLAETRSSTSPTATLSDYVIGSFETCSLDLPNSATVSADGIPPITSNEVVIQVVSDHDGGGAALASLGAEDCGCGGSSALFGTQEYTSGMPKTMLGGKAKYGFGPASPFKWNAVTQSLEVNMKSVKRMQLQDDVGTLDNGKANISDLIYKFIGVTDDTQIDLLNVVAL